MRNTIEQCKKLFESITCLRAEGVEFFSQREILDAIAGAANKGYDICKKALQQDDSADDYKYCDCGDKSTPINIGPVVLGCRSCHKKKVYKDYKKDIGVFPEPKSTA